MTAPQINALVVQRIEIIRASQFGRLKTGERLLFSYSGGAFEPGRLLYVQTRLAPPIWAGDPYLVPFRCGYAPERDGVFAVHICRGRFAIARQA